MKFKKGDRLKIIKCFDPNQIHEPFITLGKIYTILYDDKHDNEMPVVANNMGIAWNINGSCYILLKKESNTPIEYLDNIQLNERHYYD